MSTTDYEVIMILASVVGMTWALRTKLADIESALRGHVEKTDTAISDLKAQVVELRTKRRR